MSFLGPLKTEIVSDYYPSGVPEQAKQIRKVTSPDAATLCGAKKPLLKFIL